MIFIAIVVIIVNEVIVLFNRLLLLILYIFLYTGSLVRFLFEFEHCILIGHYV